MKLLMIGDVVSQPGCETVRSCLPDDIFIQFVYDLFG